MIVDLIINIIFMATATTTDDELIILEDDTATPELATENTGSKLGKLSLGGLMGKKETATEDSLIVEEPVIVEDSKAIVDLGESLETTNEASDLFKEAPSNEAQDDVIDLFGETETTLVAETAEPEINLVEEPLIVEEPVAAMFGESALEQDLKESEVSLVEEPVVSEAEVDIFATPEADVVEDVVLTEEAPVVDVKIEEEVSLVAETVEPEVSLIEDEASIFGSDDTSAQDDSQAGDDTVVSEESMNEILSATIAKLESRKAVIIKAKAIDKDKIKTLKSQIKELESDIADFEEAIAEDTKEQTKITNNVKSLNAMKLKA